MAARRPAGPLPMTMKSYRVIIERITRVSLRLATFHAKEEV
jgi:hypothetical protein